MDFGFSVGKAVAAGLWHWLKVPARYREARDKQRLYGLLGELRMIDMSLARAINDHGFSSDPETLFGILVGIALARSQTILDRFFAGCEITVSLKTEAEKPNELRCWYPKDRLSEHRFGAGINTISKDRTVAGTLFKSKRPEPVFVNDIADYKNIYAEDFSRFAGTIGSLLVWPIMIHPQGPTLGVLKVDSRHKCVFRDTPACRTLMSQLSAHFGLVFSSAQHIKVTIASGSGEDFTQAIEQQIVKQITAKS